MIYTVNVKINIEAEDVADAFQKLDDIMNVAGAVVSYDSENEDQQWLSSNC